eukprot:7828656-Lingulodinium_polyedra.AAC.1
MAAGVLAANQAHGQQQTHPRAESRDQRASRALRGGNDGGHGGGATLANERTRRAVAGEKL